MWSDAELFEMLEFLEKEGYLAGSLTAEFLIEIVVRELEDARMRRRDK